MATSINSFIQIMETQPGFQDSKKGLESAIKKGNLNLVKEIVEKGFPTNWPIDQEILPIHLSIRENQPEITAYLLENGASSELPDAQKLNAFDHAALMNDQAQLGLLLSHKLGKDLKEIQEQLVLKGPSYLEALNEKIDRLSVSPVQDYSKIIFEPSQIEKTKRLGKVTGEDFMKMADLSRAAYTGVLPQSQSLGPLRIINQKDANGYAPIHYAIIGGQISSLETLVAAKANIKTLTQDGNSLLHFAALHGSKRIVSRLIELGLDPNLQNAQRGNPSPLCSAEREHLCGRSFD